jgi:hypothetical protein
VWRRLLLLPCLLLGLAPGVASALNQVTLQPAAVTVPPGGSTVLELRIAFDEEALGGGIVIELDPAVAAFDSFSFDPAFPDDPSLRLVCPNALDPLCAGFDDGDGTRVLIAFGAQLTLPDCDPPITGTRKVGDLTLDAVAVGQASISVREDDGVAGPFVGCIGVDFDPPSFSGTVLTVATIVDTDGDGIPNATDRCPAFASADNTDVDGNGRGAPCECGDQTGDGRVNVSDIVGINVRLFTPSPPPLCGPGISNPCSLCDADNNNLCNVSDIVAVNTEIFSAGNTSRCARSPQ